MKRAIDMRRALPLLTVLGLTAVAAHADVVGVEPVVKIVDQVLAGQVHRLKRYIESGPLR